MTDNVAIQYAQTVDGVRIAYGLIGDGPGLPIVAVPPFPGVDVFEARTVARWQEMARDRRVLIFNRRGVGSSQRSPADVSLKALVRDVDAVIRASELSEYALHGVSSAGSMVALQSAASEPAGLRALVLSNPTSRGWVGSDVETLHELLAIARSDWNLFTEMIHIPVFGSLERLVSQAGTGVPVELRRAYEAADFIAQFEVFAGSDVHPLLSQVHVPTLVVLSPIASQQRREAGVHDVAAGLANARLISVTTDGFPADAIRHFLDALDRKPEPPATRTPGVGAFRAILFTDLEAHTEMMDRLGDQAGRAVLREHERITREALSAHGGTEVKTMGDGFMASFASVTNSLECAQALQQAFSDPIATGDRIAVRIGINAGEPIEEDNDFFGTSVIVAARLAASASGGQIVVTDVVRALVAGKKFLFADRGLSSLKGFEEPVRTWEVVW